MPRVNWSGGALLAPAPAAMVSCGTITDPCVLTIAWTGILCTHPAMTYVSIRPARHSYGIIKESGEFVINLTTSALVRKTDWVGMKSGAKHDKFKEMGLTPVESAKVSAPTIAECPISLECKVTQIMPLGTHDVFIAEIVGVSADSRYIDSKGKLNISQCGLCAFAHGEYFALGRKLGDFGFSVRKKPKNQAMPSKDSKKSSPER